MPNKNLLVSIVVVLAGTKLAKENEPEGIPKGFARANSFRSCPSKSKTQ
ncbi:hypothetical protein [uncultured Psychroserpens sp.]|nr:hypothetical protein [uncultured Psychroserpens sp.]